MPDMVHVRKSHAGTDSAGHTWPTDGAVIPVPVEHALVLARIPDGGFTLLETDIETEAGVASEAEPKAGTQRTPQAKAPRPAR